MFCTDTGIFHLTLSGQIYDTAAELKLLHSVCFSVCVPQPCCCRHQAGDLKPHRAWGSHIFLAHQCNWWCTVREASSSPVLTCFLATESSTIIITIIVMIKFHLLIINIFIHSLYMFCNCFPNCIYYKFIYFCIMLHFISLDLLTLLA